MTAAQHGLRFLLARGPLAAAGTPVLTRAAACLLCQPLTSAKELTAQPYGDHRADVALLAAAHHSSATAPEPHRTVQAASIGLRGCFAEDDLREHSRTGGAGPPFLALLPDRWGGWSAPRTVVQTQGRQQVFRPAVKPPAMT